MIDLYSAPTPNGWKASITLEELGTPYRVHPIDLGKNVQKEPWFLEINPNGRIPAIVDRANGDFAVFESGAIMLYLCDRDGSGKLLPRDAKGRSRVEQWLMFQMGGVGPMFGQVGFFHKFAGREYEDKRPRDRYVAEAKRLLNVLEQRLAGRAWIMGDEYTIADIATFPWINNLVGFYGAGDLVGFASFGNVARVLQAFLARPAVARGLQIPKRPD
jgi:GST-like protein